MPKYRTALSHERLTEVLAYDPETGVFKWKVRTSNRVKVGEVAGSLSNKGYKLIKIDGKRYCAHRLAWFYCYGQWPSDKTDHRNRTRDDNRISNLRECNRAENQQNQKLRKDSSSGLTGVTFDNSRQKWKSQIGKDGMHYNIGRFPTAEAAHEAYKQAKRELHTFNPEMRGML